MTRTIKSVKQNMLTIFDLLVVVVSFPSLKVDKFVSQLSVLHLLSTDCIH